MLTQTAVEAIIAPDEFQKFLDYGKTVQIPIGCNHKGQQMYFEYDVQQYLKKRDKDAELSVSQTKV